MECWHKSFKDSEYEDRTVEIELNEVIEFSAWGTGHYKTGAIEYIEKKCAGNQSCISLNWIAEPAEKIKDLKVQLIKKSSFEGYYGITNILTFVDENNNKLTWFTSTVPAIQVNDYLTLSATVKKNDEYKGEKITVITRAKLRKETEK